MVMISPSNERKNTSCEEERKRKDREEIKGRLGELEETDVKRGSKEEERFRSKQER